MNIDGVQSATLFLKICLVGACNNIEINPFSCDIEILKDMPISIDVSIYDPFTGSGEPIYLVQLANTSEVYCRHFKAALILEM